MTTRRRYKPGEGFVEERVPGTERRSRRGRFGQKGRIGEIRFDHTRNRIEARGADGRVVGAELPRGN